jgi:hypothetical protein
LTSDVRSVLDAAIAADPEAAQLRAATDALVQTVRPGSSGAIRAVVAAGHSAMHASATTAVALAALHVELARLDRVIVLIGGGTRTGINAAVGDAAQARGAPAEGFLPRAALDKGQADRDTTRYRLHVRDGNAFSALDAVAYWEFLTARGIAPSEVRLVGIGGGAISSLEYLIALRLGAPVGLFAGTGRAAERVLAEGAATALLPGTVGAFVTS